MNQFENKIDLENMVIHLNNFTTIIDVKKFIESHSQVIERNKDNIYFESYSERLNEVKEKLNESSNR